MTYLSYEDYVLKGGSLDVTTFNDLEYEARMYIDWVTFNRLHVYQDINEIPEAVKECMYHIMKLIQNRLEALNTLPGDGSMTNMAVGAGIASQSNDGVSISYNVLSAKDIIETSQKELEDVMGRYLQGIRNSLGHRLLFRGLYPDEEVL